jgi:transaldolase
MADLLLDGIDKFVTPFQSLMDSLQEKVQKLSPVA